MRLFSHDFHTESQRAPIGMPAFCAFLAAFCIDMLLGVRADQYCLGPPIHNWAWQCGRVCLFVMSASAAASVVALKVDRRKLYAIATLAGFFPALLLDAMHQGCW
jgi:hypothetical protein